MSDYQTYKLDGEYHLAMGDIEQAVECFKSAMDINQESIEPLLGLAAACVYEGEFESALKLYMKAAAMEKSARAHAGIGLVLSQMEEHDEGFTHYLMALSIDPVNKIALNGLVQLGYSIDRVPEILPVLSRALETNTDDNAIRFSYATCLFSLDRKDESIAEFKAILKSDPKHAAAREVLSHIAA